MNINKKKIICSFVLASLFVVQSYSVFETVYAASATDNVIVTLDVTAGITISNGADVTMAPVLGVAANSSIGTSSWTVKTNSVGGYSLAVKASTNPALQSGSNNFADYTEATPGTPDAWNVTSGLKEFGYSAFGTDVPTATWGTGANCGSGGTPTATLKYDGFTTSDRVIATKATITSTAGEITNICFAAQQNGVYAPSGTYTATITATATTL